ncbi:MAG: ACT domain-containing protein, partial [Pseudomonadales bacterium]|nr:ACT domain-containing protein [Pseudomonadales bacterium]
MREIVLINITGEDRPGLTAAITGVLASNGVNILDIGQAVIHGVLSLGFLVEIPQAEQVSAVLKDLQPLIAKEGLQLRFDPISEEHYQRWVNEQSRQRHVVTLMSRQVTAHELQQVTSVISQHGLNIEQTDRLSGRVPLDAPTQLSKSCIELRVCGEPTDLQALREAFFNLAQELNVDIALQEDTLFRRHRRLAVFDMDSTLIQAEVIDELAKAAGVGEQVSA